MKRKIDYKSYIGLLEFSILFSALLSIKDVYNEGLVFKIFLLIILVDFIRRIIFKLKKVYDIILILLDKRNSN